MQHWKLTISYDGTGFHGWQVQPGLRTVQQTLANTIERLTGERTMPQASGRTDTGVHALAQVVSFDLEARVPAENLKKALNRLLPSSVRVLCVTSVDASFHARYAAIAKTYEYRIFERRLRLTEAFAKPEERVCPPFLAPYVWDCRWPLDSAAMQSAAACVVGTHDFSSFAAVDAERRDPAIDGAARSSVRTIFASTWERKTNGNGEMLLVYRVRGSGFLHHMVRNLAGTFVDVGRGAIAADAVPRILAACDRAQAGPTAPARGLFLHSVEYDGAEAQPA